MLRKTIFITENLHCKSTYSHTRYLSIRTPSPRDAKAKTHVARSRPRPCACPERGSGVTGTAHDAHDIAQSKRSTRSLASHKRQHTSIRQTTRSASPSTIQHEILVLALPTANTLVRLRLVATHLHQPRKPHPASILRLRALPLHVPRKRLPTATGGGATSCTGGVALPACGSLRRAAGVGEPGSPAERGREGEPILAGA